MWTFTAIHLLPQVLQGCGFLGPQRLSTFRMNGRPNCDTGLADRSAASQPVRVWKASHHMVSLVIVWVAQDRTQAEFEFDPFRTAVIAKLGELYCVGIFDTCRPIKRNIDGVDLRPLVVRSVTRECRYRRTFIITCSESLVIPKRVCEKTSADSVIENISSNSRSSARIRMGQYERRTLALVI